MAVPTHDIIASSISPPAESKDAHPRVNTLAITGTKVKARQIGLIAERQCEHMGTKKTNTNQKPKNNTTRKTQAQCETRTNPKTPASAQSGGHANRHNDPDERGKPTKKGKEEKEGDENQERTH